MDARIYFLPSQRTVSVATGTTLLAAAREAGLPVASACGADGICGRCGMTVVSGTDALSRESDDEVRAKRMNRVDANERLACRARIGGDLAVTASYW